MTLSSTQKVVKRRRQRQTNAKKRKEDSRRLAESEREKVLKDKLSKKMPMLEGNERQRQHLVSNKNTSSTRNVPIETPATEDASRGNTSTPEQALGYPPSDTATIMKAATANSSALVAAMAKAKKQLPGPQQPTSTVTTEQIRMADQLPKKYVFVPKGNVFVTKHCRQLTNASAFTLYQVSSPTGTRLGLGVPRTIFAQVQALAASTAASRAAAVQARDKRTLVHAAATLDTLYPHIPSDDRYTILSHAFAKGSRRVGRSTVLAEDVRMKRAVSAYARHFGTGYDAMVTELRRGGVQVEKARQDARTRVRKEVKQVLARWTGEKESGGKKSKKKPKKPKREEPGSTQPTSATGLAAARTTPGP